MSFSNPVVGGGGGLIIASIHSENFVSGSTGWSIDRDGNAEFNNVTVRGLFKLPDNYRSRMTDMLVNPAFGSTGAYVEFGLGEWDRPVFQTFSNAATIETMFTGYNNNTATSILRVAHAVYSGPTGSGPWTLESGPNDNIAALVTSAGIGATAPYNGHWTTVYADIVVSTTPIIFALTSDLANRPWIQVRPAWKITSGSAATAKIITGRLVVTPQS